MVDASVLLSFTRFVQSQADRTILFSSEFKEAIHIHSSGKEVLKVEVGEAPKGKGVGFYALYGLITLKRYSYLMLVTKANIVGHILERKILQVDEIKWLPLTPSGQLNDIASEDMPYVQMLKQIIATKTLLFSHDYDLSNSFDQLMANNSQFQNPQYTSDNHSYWKIPNTRFAYNWVHLKFTESLNMTVKQYWQTVFISGCVMQKYCKLNQQSDCYFILLSRRETLRSGKRFIQRGCDNDGNCSNFAETEQILILDRKSNYAVYSFVQTRGSMPFSWEQTPTLKWSPKALIRCDKQYNISLAKKHLDQQMKVYPQQTLINLIDKKGTQQMLGKYFTEVVSAQQNPKIKYVWFDFHHECRKMKYENLSKLLNEISGELKKGGYFSAEISKTNVNVICTLQKKQEGVCRTNCMDCLDRTNVVQGVIARNILLQILHETKIVPQLTGEAFQTLPTELENVFRELWTRNADVMSILYSGTGALKTDFTRTGKRTFMGALQDGKNSLHRYYLNNFQDGHNQNCIDLMLGKIDLKATSYKPPKLNSGLLFVIFFFVLVYAVLKASPSFLPDEDHPLMGNTTNLLILLASSYIVFKALCKTHRLFIQRPIIEQ